MTQDAMPMDAARRMPALPRVRRLGKSLSTALRHVWLQIRKADISTVMLVFGILLALMVILGLAVDPVSRRH